MDAGAGARLVTADAVHGEPRAEESLSGPPFSAPKAPRIKTSSFAIKGWVITAVRGPIIGEKDIEALAARLGNALVLPEALFGHSSLSLKHEPSATTIVFNAVDALAAWKDEDLAPLKVDVAEEWQRARQHEISRQNAAVLDYDWTFTTPYAGSTTSTSVNSNSRSSSTTTTTSTSGAHGMGTRDAAAAAAIMGRTPAAMNGTRVGGDTGAGGSPAAGDEGASLESAPPSAAAEQRIPPAPCHPHEPQWRPTSTPIDKGMLMRREPILFYEDIPLYESELDDNGTAQLSVKIRVMPSCWFVLLRFWLKVEDSFVRLREARYFCALESAPHPPSQASSCAPPRRPHCVVTREVKHCEGQLRDLRCCAASQPGSAHGGGVSRAHPDADSTASLFSALSPTGMTHYALEELHL